MFKLERVDETFVARAPHRFVHRISFSLGPQRVFDVITDASYDDQWFPDFVSARWETPAPPGVGSIRRYRLKYMTIVEEFLVWQPGARVTFRLNECSLPIVQSFVEDYVLTSRPDGGTDLVWRVCYAVDPWLSPLHPIVRPFFAKDFDRASVNLQSLLDKLGKDINAATAADGGSR